MPINYFFSETIVSVETKTRKGDENSLPPMCYKCRTSILRCESNIILHFFNTCFLEVNINGIVYLH